MGELTRPGSLTPCGTVLDSWIVEVGPCGSALAVDAVSAETTFDPFMIPLAAVGDYDSDPAAQADDDFDCTVPPRR
ncbi:MAG: hypothetical protein ACJA1R_001935 [Flavobacteriales bacterium]